RSEGVQRGLRFPAAFCPGFGLDPSKFDVGVVGLRRMIDLCATAGVAMVLLGGTDDPSLQDVYYQTVLECCDYAQERGIVMMVKPHGGLNATSAQCAAIVRLVGHPAFRICYDPGNIFFYSDGALDPKEDVKDAVGLVGAVSVRDFLPPKNVDVTPGDGEVDFPSVIRSLRSGGFLCGDFLIETVRATESMEDRRQEVIRARQFVEKLIATLPPA
ncbi:MAG: TIM barrel protein, partial [Planctomycetia bacterium]|nr:TIM barrel protein [Planctomycetia bacterium]